MKVAAIISEYNPFHKGHKYQIDKIREILGEDTAIIAIMSGNYTQRGEIAICDKSIRAEAAIECGVNLVLEIPFPFSMSSAEFFAKSGVKIANEIEIVDYLCFGSESGDLNELSDIANVISSNEYMLTLDEVSNDPQYMYYGYPKLCQIAISRVYGKEIGDRFLSPNNILAIEYLRAITAGGCNLIPLTIKREGSGYHDDIINPMEEYQSASAIREELQAGYFSALDYVPENAKSVYMKAIEDGKMPSDVRKLDSAVVSYFRLNSPRAWVDYQDAGGGLYNRLCDCGSIATSIRELVAHSETKKYTKARIRRAMWNSYFGVTSSDVRRLPCYTQILAMDYTGRVLLKDIKRNSDFPVITKPSSYRDYNFDVIAQKEMSNRADAVYGLALNKADPGCFPLTFTPYVKV